MPPKQEPKPSVGGFSGLPESDSVARRKAAQARKDTPHEQRAAAASSRVEEDVMRLANVPFDGWQKEKEKRCEVAFNRILEKDWYDKFEANMSNHELIHVNAVREHYAMRRDKIKTPAAIPFKGSNAITCLEWAAEMEAIEELNRDTGVRNGFRDMLLKKAIKKSKERGHNLPPSHFFKPF